MTDAIPITRRAVSPQRAEQIRQAVRGATALPPRSGGTSRLARESDTPALLAFLSDPAVHAPIYSIPRPLDSDRVRGFINAHIAERALGTGLLFLNLTETGEIAGYSDIQVWPRWAAGELTGGLHPARQGDGEGTSGAAASFAWMFDALGLDLICETAAPDNVRTARLLDGLGFRRMGEVSSTRPDGTTRPSRVWEITRWEWAARGQREPGHSDP
ncbi:MAG: GNAT family N-acetyltransferase [Alphaproteobacteria bacterium]|jgi:RimJ/RimL family protein N-acetyltransferase|nr:GNAT family N-acetyltransferase [Alphaproteobacteria bacterium]